MKFFIFLILCLFFIKNIYAEDIEIIELHDNSIDPIILDAIQQEPELIIDNQSNMDSSLDIDDEIILVETNTDSILEEDVDDEIILVETNTDSILEEDVDDEIILVETNTDSILEENGTKINIAEVITLPALWEKINKEDLIFLLNNIHSVRSETLRNELLQVLNIDNTPPKNFNKDDFENLIIKSLNKFGNRKKAYQIIKLIGETDNNDYNNFYINFELNYLLATYSLSEACEFRTKINNQNNQLNNNFLLKVDIFCLFLKDKVNEADLLNILLEESEVSKDFYFQNIYNSLKNNITAPLEFIDNSYDVNSIFLYSAMHRVGNIPLSSKFLEKDSSNLAMPIILSSSTDISLRLDAAHQAYKSGLLKSESLSALYQTVDFSFNELNNPENFLEKLENQPQIGMSFFYQLANIQLLPSTRIEAIIDFWQFAEKNDLELLAYDISKTLLNSIEPSKELSKYGAEIGKAYIYNNDFELAQKWLLFSESTDNNLDNLSKLQSTRLLYNLFNSNNYEKFQEVLNENFSNFENNFYSNSNQNRIKKEILFTIYSVLNEKDKNPIIIDKIIADSRPMPSGYIISKIRECLVTENYIELFLTIVASLNNQKWIDLHPEHLRLILISLKQYNNESFFTNIILEILNESKII